MLELLDIDTLAIDTVARTQNNVDIMHQVMESIERLWRPSSRIM
jgi:hypothetical protein